MKPRKLTRRQFVELAKQGPVLIQGPEMIDKNVCYIAVKVNSDNIKMSEMFKQQLIREDKYDKTYIGFLIWESESEKPYPMRNLPIYGDPDKYVTKHLCNSFEEAVMRDLRSREISLLKRRYEYELKEFNREVK